MRGIMRDHIETLLAYAVRQGLMEHWDTIQKRNELYALMRYAPEEVDASVFNEADHRAGNETATEMLTALSDEYAARGLFEEDTAAERDRFEAAVMGLLMPRMSETLTLFLLHYMDSPVKATDYFYKLCRSANYIQVDRIKKDLYWRAETEYGAMEITVNLSKPEKDPRDIAAARAKPQTASYPQCLLCLENVGFQGTRVWPARQNLRVIPMTLDGEPWYFQYSPYAYYNEHCIVLSEKHEPMRVTNRTFSRLVEFVNDFPHYFIGSNAGLPIVGGSILAHDHFQGGRHTFPMELADAFAHYAHPEYPLVDITLVRWPMSVIRLTVTEAYNQDEERRAEAERQLIALSSHILDVWRAYSDEAAGIMAATGETPHNAVTPIARYNRDKKLEMDIVLRNNRTTDEFPYGIFHPHEQWHHIKKENIGLIEVMGLAVLPGRLRSELAEVSAILSGGENCDVSSHQSWLEELLARYGNKNTPDDAERIVQDEVGRVFVQVLKDCGVFKDDAAGRVQFAAFMAAAGMTVR